MITLNSVVSKLETLATRLVTNLSPHDCLDCGGAPGYMRLLEAMQKPRSAEYKNMLQWLGHVYKPEVFSTKIRFDNPKDRLKMLL